MGKVITFLLFLTKYEFLHYRILILEIEEVRKICWAFHDHYNKKRFHQALGYRTQFEYVTNCEQQTCLPAGKEGG